MFDEMFLIPQFFLLSSASIDAKDYVMPIYEYKCDKCQKTMEFIQKFSDAPKTDCKICNAKNSLKKLISSPAIQFKGSGWYLTDYSDKGKKVQAEARKESSSAADSQKPASKSKKESKAS